MCFFIRYPLSISFGINHLHLYLSRYISTYIYNNWIPKHQSRMEVFVLLLRYFLKLKSLKLQSGVVNSQIDPNSITKNIYCSKLKLLQSFYYLSMGFINLLIDTYNKSPYYRNGLYCQNQYNLCSTVINGLQ